MDRGGIVVRGVDDVEETGLETRVVLTGVERGGHEHVFGKDGR